MTDRVETYEVAGPPRIDISSSSGDIVVKAGDSDLVTVVLSGDAAAVENTTIDATPDSVVINTKTRKGNRRLFSRGVDIIVTAPEGGSLRIGSASGDVRVRLITDDVEVNSGSGDVRIDKESGHVRVKVASGRVVVDRAVSDADVSSASGDVTVGFAADARINTASGSISVGRVDGTARIKSASGEVRVKDFRGNDLDIATMSGDVSAGLASGRTVDAQIKTLSGDLRNRIEPSDGPRTGSMKLFVRSFSGDVTLNPSE